MRMSEFLLTLCRSFIHFNLSDSGQFPELHARICKTYLDALEGDKCLPTLYGAIVGLSAMGNHAVRTLLLPHLSAILGRLQEGEQGNTSGNRRGSTIGGNGANSVASGSNGHVNGAGVSAQDTQTQGKRKRSDSIDNNHIATSATGANDTNGSTTGSSSSSSRVVTKFNKHTASKVLQEQVTRGMCREALIKALGEFGSMSVWIAIIYYLNMAANETHHIYFYYLTPRCALIVCYQAST